MIKQRIKNDKCNDLKRCAIAQLIRLRTIIFKNDKNDKKIYDKKQASINNQ